MIERPAFLIGGGAHSARHELREVLDRAGIPAFRTWNALDIVTDDMPCYAGTVGTYGGPGRNFGIQNCDLLISLGCRLSGRITGGLPETFARAAEKWIVDIDQAMLPGEHIKRTVADALIEFGELPSTENTYEWFTWCKSKLKKYDPVKPEMLTGEFHHYGFMRRLSELLPANAIVVYDTGGNAIMMGHCFRSKWGQRIFSSNGNSPMGFSFCGALGAWFADPSRPIICIIGDGGFNMNLQEIQTMVNYGANVKTFIINNHILGNTKSYQRVNGKAELACGPDGYKPPNFRRVAYAYGVQTLEISSFDLLEHYVEHVLRSDKAWIVDVVDHDRCNYEPRLSRWDCGIEELYPPLPKEEFLQNMLIEPLAGWEQRAQESR